MHALGDTLKESHNMDDFDVSPNSDMFDVRLPVSGAGLQAPSMASTRLNSACEECKR